MKTPAQYFFRTLCVMVLLPVVFLVGYPLVYLVLPETTARLADLPQDLLLFVLLDAGLVPLIGVWFYFRARHRASAKGVREARDTRDVL